MSKSNIDVLIGGPKNKHSYTYKEVILKENFPLSQQMVEKNRKYVVKWNFDLNGETVTVPENCILEFDGGSLKNGTIIGQDTVFINVGDVDIWGENLTREGTWRINGEQVQSDWNQSDSTKPDYIKNKPTIPEEVTVDTELSETSENPVQNKVINTALKGKQPTLESGQNIKTINGQSILGRGNIRIESGGGKSYTKQESDAKYQPKVAGKGLSTNDYTNQDKEKVAAALTEHQDISGKADKSDTYTKEELDNMIASPETETVVLDTNESIIVGDIFPHNASDWERGSLDGDTEIESANRCRTVDYIDITGATLFEITRQNTSLPMNVAIQYYDANKHYLNWQSYISSGSINVNVEGAKYIRFLVKPETEGAFEITPERAATAVTCVMSVGVSLDTIPLEQRANKLFRTPGTTPNSYREWAWNGTKWVLLATHTPGIDNEPTEGSDNFVKSGGILNKIKEISTQGIEIVKKHVDVISQEGGRFDIFPQNFVNGTTNNEGEVVPSTIRIVSEFVKVNPYTRYLIEAYEQGGNNFRVAFCWYDDNKSYLGFSSYHSIPCIVDTINAEYIRALLMYYPDGQQISPDQFVPLSMKAVDMKTSDSGYFVPYTNAWEMGTINDQGELVSTSVRIRTKNYISIEGGKSYVFGYDSSSYGADLCLYDKDFNYLGDTLYKNDGDIVYLGDSVRYCKILMKPEPDGAIDLVNAVTSGVSITPASNEAEGSTGLSKLNIGLWNIGLLNHGVVTDGKWGIPDAEVDATLPSIKNIITDANADIFFITEYSNHVDRSYTRDSYNELFKHFYPYKYSIGEPWSVVFSKYPLFNLKIERNVIEIDDDIPYDLSGRPIVYGYIIVGGQKVGIMCCHLSPYSSDRRIKEATRICTLMAEYDRCIIAGDLNSDPGVEGFERDMKPFRDAGYEFANGGYWGYKNTYNPNYPPERGGGQMYIDNILTRGIVIDNYTVGNDMSVSDHLPVRSELSVFVSEE